VRAAGDIVAERPPVRLNDAEPEQRGFTQRIAARDDEVAAHGKFDSAAVFVESPQRPARGNDAVVLVEIGGRVRRPVAFHVCRRCCRHAQAAIQHAADAARVAKLADLHRDIEAAADQIQAIILEPDVENDIGIAPIEFPDVRQESEAPEEHRHRHPQPTARRLLGGPHGCLRVFDVVQDLLAAFIEKPAFLVRRYLARRAHQQLRLKLFLEPGECLRYRGHRYTELSRGRRQAAAFDNSHEGHHRCELVHWRLSKDRDSLGAASLALDAGLAYDARPFRDLVIELLAQCVRRTRVRLHALLEQDVAHGGLAQHLHGFARESFTMSSGVRAGANNPNRPMDARRGMPSSAVVGT